AFTAVWVPDLQSGSFSIQQVMSAPFPSELVASKYGSSIAWVFDKQGERNVWFASAPVFQARQLTHYTGDDGQDILALLLSADGRIAVYARGTELNHEGRSANPSS